MKRLKKEQPLIRARKDSYRIDPLKIKVDFNDKDGNPRTDYKISPEKWKNFKESIKENGVLVSLKLYKDEEGNWNLAHGYRRLQAVLELLKEGTKIELVPFEQVIKNEEQILVDHFTLNNGEPLNDVELAEGLKRLKTMMGDDVKESDVARRVNLDYQKVHNLLKFVEKATTQVKKAVMRGDMSFAIANKIVRTSKSSSEQISLLKEGKQTSKEQGNDKIRAQHIKKVGSTSISKIPFEIKLRMALDNALQNKDVEKDIVKIFTQVIDAVKKTEPIENIIELLKIQYA